MHNQAADPIAPVTDGTAPAQLKHALCDSFDLDGLIQMVRMQLGTDLALIVPVQGRTLTAVVDDLVMWAARKPDLGLPGLLASAINENSTSPRYSHCSKSG